MTVGEGGGKSKVRKKRLEEKKGLLQISGLMSIFSELKVHTYKRTGGRNPDSPLVAPLASFQPILVSIGWVVTISEPPAEDSPFFFFASRLLYIPYLVPLMSPDPAAM